MSYKLHLDEICDEDKKFIETTLTIRQEKCPVTYVFDVDEDAQTVSIPFHFAHKEFNLPKPDAPGSTPTTFAGELRPNQCLVRDKCVHLLEQTGSAIMCAQPGFGKTITSIEILCRFSLKTIIFVKQVMLAQQWLDALQKHAPTKVVQHVKNKKINAAADVYLLNPILLKPQKTPSIPKNAFEHVKFVIVDELHQAVSAVLHKAFFRVQPDYFLGLSATPRRPAGDRFEAAISWFFGDNVVGEQLHHKHLVHIIKTPFKPAQLKYNGMQLDWNHVLTTQSEDESRNATIVDTVLSRPERVWLVLVKRVSHAATLARLFEQKGVVAETLTGSKREFDKSCKILIGTTSKIGVGFDHSPINALFVAADVVEYFEQFLGRCMRVPGNVPVIYDMEDAFSILKKHAKLRQAAYTRHGGEIKSYG